MPIQTKWVLTGWCAQHDENTFEPTNARAYELASLSGQESAGIVLLLMSIKNPSPDIIKAVDSAITWFEKTKITGYRIEWITNENGKKEKRMVADANAEPMWARFMELEDNTPFFCDRDGIKKPSMFDIGEERRIGYSWYSTSANNAIAKYAQWKEKLAK
jgi:pectinesterase